MSDDLDTAAFLQNIQKLGQERDQQDNERMRKLEEDIERDRKERMARRAGMRLESHPRFVLIQG